MNRRAQLQQTISLRLRQARLAAGYSEPNEFCQAYQLPVIKYLEQEAGITAIKYTEASYYCELLKIQLRWLLLGEERLNR